MTTQQDPQANSEDGTPDVVGGPTPSPTIAAEEGGVARKAIGRTSATERDAITSDKFPFWLPDDVAVLGSVRPDL